MFSPLLALGRPKLMAAMCGLTVAGCALSPHFLSPGFPETRLARMLPGLLPPVGWSMLYAFGAALVTALLWLGTALIRYVADGSWPPGNRLSPQVVLYWALGLQAAGFTLVLAAGTRGALLLALIGAGLGNAWSLPPFQLNRLGLLANLIPGGGVILTLAGGLVAQGRLTEVGLLSALVLGLLASVCSPIREFATVKEDRERGVVTLPVLLGEGPAVLAGMVAVSLAHLLALGTLVQRIGMQQGIMAGFGLGMAAQLYVLSRAAGDPSFASKAGDRSAMIFLGVTALYVSAQALY